MAKKNVVYYLNRYCTICAEDYCEEEKYCVETNRYDEHLRNIIQGLNQII